MATKYEIISSDGHIVEPPHLWTKFLPRQFQDRAPRLVKDQEGGDAWELVRGAPPSALGQVTSEGKWGKRYEDIKWFGSTYDSIRPGCFNGPARLEDQNIDGVTAEVIFPPQRTMRVFMAQDDNAFHLAGIEAYNNWLYEEFNAPDRTRLLGLAQMPAIDVKSSVDALRNAKKAGFRGVILLAYPSGNPELSAADNPFWAAAEEEHMPVCIHQGLSVAGKGRSSETLKAAAKHAGAERGVGELVGGLSGLSSASGFITSFIFAGVFDRFPELQMVAVETGAGWVPHFLEEMDDRWWRNRIRLNSTLNLLPSEYFRRNWKVTFIREFFAVQSRHYIGVDNMMWSNDYPHHKNDWPYSRRVISDLFMGVPADEKRKMVRDNAIATFGLAG